MNGSQSFLTISVGEAFARIAERYGTMSFEGAPSWARPVAQLVWILAVVHVVIYGAIGLGRGIRLLAKRASKLPAERRVAACDAVIIDGALEREILCYALYKRNNHIWTPDDNRPPDWLIKLRVAGLIEISSAQWDTRALQYSSCSLKIHGSLPHQVQQQSALAK